MNKERGKNTIGIRNSNRRGRRARHRSLLILLVFLGAVGALGFSAIALAQKQKKARQQAAEVRLERETAAKPYTARSSRERKSPGGVSVAAATEGDPIADSKPREEKLVKAREFKGDLRQLPQTPPVKMERPEREEPEITPRTVESGVPVRSVDSAAPRPPKMAPAVAAPTPLVSFDGLDFTTWGAGHPPDTNGDVGPNYFIQTINTSIGIYNKTGGAPVAAFTFNTFMSQGNFGNLCDTNNFGDPVVLYDSFEDRWIITDFAFTLDGSNNVINPPGNFQCIAASKTGDPISGGWNFYSINTAGGLGDYPKFGIWPDGLYMSVNMFGYAASGAFQNPRVYAFNKAQMYAGFPTAQSVSFDAPSADFTILPSNARLQTGTPPTGTPNYYLSTEEFLNGLTIYKFHVDWDRTALSTFTGPDIPIAATSWPNATPPNALSLGGNALDVLAIRAMVQNQYTNLGGVESLWAAHTVRRANTTGFAAPRYYQVDVTGGTVNPNIPQAATWDPDGANVISRFMPSVAVDRAGNMALGYSTSSSTTKPAIKYAGRLSTDPINTLSLTEQLLIQGTGTQTGSCGGTCTRWGDYSAMTLDPDGCRFWYTNMYYNVDGLAFLTRIGSFQFSPCTTVGAGGILQGTITATPGGAPLSGATVALGSRTTTTNGSGFYSFSGIPAGTYASETASQPGYAPASATGIIITDAGTTTHDFALSTTASFGCLTDTTQSDLQTGALSNSEITTSPGDVKLTGANGETADQVSSPAALSTTNNLSATTWTGQTFRAGITGNLTKLTVGLGLASGTSGTITVEIRDLSGINPGTTVLATSTLGPVTNVGTAANYTTTFATPAAVVAGTSYSIVLRTSVGNTVFGVRGSTAGGSSLANGQVFTTTNSGSTWTGVAADLLFTSFVTPPFSYSSSGNFVSGLKDANPIAGTFAHWTGFSWTATTPANTSVKFQAAGSNSPGGPFNFIGPDGTAGSFYTSTPTNLFQFSNFRYLKYKAYLSTTDPSTTPTLSSVTVCLNDTSSPTAAPATISGQITTAEGLPLAGAIVWLSGSRVATAITNSEGAYKFENNDSNNFYTVTPSLANYHFSPANRSFSLLANKTDAVFTAAADAVASSNAIDTTEYFVRQQYRDFLGREPDQSGLEFWSARLNQCGGDSGCLRAGRIDISAAFFQSQEFHETGSFIYRLYQGALGRQSSFEEFATDRQQVTGGADLEQSKTAFANAFVNRAEFQQKYQARSTGNSFVDAILQTLQNSAQVDLSSERANLIGLYDSAGSVSEGRARVLRAVADSNQVSTAVRNQSFVLMEYFGYLRRGADSAGYSYWLEVLNTTGASNYRGMVCSFITSAEYQHRFGAVITRTNEECGH